jgi:hypothetical protein
MRWPSFQVGCVARSKCSTQFIVQLGDCFNGRDLNPRALAAIESNGHAAPHPTVREIHCSRRTVSSSDTSPIEISLRECASCYCSAKVPVDWRPSETPLSSLSPPASGSTPASIAVSEAATGRSVALIQPSSSSSIRFVRLDPPGLRIRRLFSKLLLAEAIAYQRPIAGSGHVA